MGFLTRLLKKVSKTKIFQAKIVLLGPSKAGKTTLVRYLEEGTPVTEEVRTTLGIDLRVKPFRIDNWEFTAIDVGGQRLYQKAFWSLGVDQADAIIYMIDGTIKPEHPEFNDSLNQFKYMLGLVEPETPLLILVNKQDLIEEKPLTIEEACELFEIRKIVGRSMTLLSSSAKYGDGVEIAMKWLVEKLNEVE